MASVLMRGVGFLLLTVIGPLFLGSTREILVRITRLSREGRSLGSRWQIGSRTAYALVSGLVWTSAFLVVRAAWQAMAWLGNQAMNRVSSTLPNWLLLVLAVLLIFIVGAFVGMMVHRYEHGGSARW
jgi:sterol desaturase/sphingolipid hydroxylase (fatty acid hydroxylase superfamily)